MFLKIKWYDKSKERQILKKEKEMWYMEMNKYAGTQTEQNLRDAFSGESEARNKYRNLLGGLYRENPVKSRNYEAVKSSKKWENVGNSYIIPALLLYRYSYI